MDELKDGSIDWEQPIDAINKVDELKAIYLLHKNIWTIELFNHGNLSFFYHKVLSPRERQVVDLKIDGLKDIEIASMLKVSPATVKRYIYNVRYIYRNKCRDRVYTKWGKLLPKIKRNEL